MSSRAHRRSGEAGFLRSDAAVLLWAGLAVVGAVVIAAMVEVRPPGATGGTGGTRAPGTSGRVAPAVTRRTVPPSHGPGSGPAWDPSLVSAAQRDEAVRLGLPVAVEEARTGMRLVLIPGGTFTMGSPGTEPGHDSYESPQHQVTLTAFYLSIAEVTNAQYKRFKSDHDSGTNFDADDQPVVNVSHTDATAFAHSLSGGYALPSEAQWEYACRAGTKMAYSFGDTLTKEQANFSGGPRKTTRAGSYPANAWALYDIHGNVYEWCADDFHSTYAAAPSDGSAWIDSPRAEFRVIRGGSWDVSAVYARSAYRGRIRPGYPYGSLGLRLARAVTVPGGPGVEPASPAPAPPSVPPAPLAPVDPPWAQPLREGVAAAAHHDGDAAALALAAAQAAGVPPGLAADLSMFVADWERPPVIEVQSPVPGSSLDAVAPTSYQIRMLGRVATGRKADRLFVDGAQVTLLPDRPLTAPTPFEATVRRQAAGAVTLRLEVRFGEVVRASLDVAYTLVPPRLPGTAERSPDASGSTPAETGPSEEELEALQQVNRLREQRGVPAVRFEPRIYRVARAHSQDQLERDYIGHQAPSPPWPTLRERFQSAGYDGNSYAEVVAKDFPDVASVLRAWMDSPRHREVLLDPELTQAAFARANSVHDQRRNRWTGDFAQPAGSGPVPSTARETAPLAVPAWAQGLVSQAQRAEGQRLGKQVAFEEPVTGMRFVLIPGGTFAMGSPGTERGHDSDESPQHQVTLPAFYLSIAEVTNAQYKRFKSDHDSGTNFNADDQPVVNVSHTDATAFALSLSGGYALPSEAQWEYACRAGTKTAYSFGDTLTKEHANFSGGPGKTTRAGSYPANAWGLYDMHGNVGEWCADDFHSTYAAAPSDGRAWLDSPRAEFRANRGGSWLYFAVLARSAIRSGFVPGSRHVSLGLRLARAVTAR